MTPIRPEPARHGRAHHGRLQHDGQQHDGQQHDGPVPRDAVSLDPVLLDDAVLESIAASLLCDFPQSNLAPSQTIQINFIADDSPFTAQQLNGRLKTAENL